MTVSARSRYWWQYQRDHDTDDSIGEITILMTVSVRSRYWWQYQWDHDTDDSMSEITILMTVSARSRYWWQYQRDHDTDDSISEITILMTVWARSRYWWQYERDHDTDDSISEITILMTVSVKSLVPLWAIGEMSFQCLFRISMAQGLRLSVLDTEICIWEITPPPPPIIKYIGESSISVSTDFTPYYRDTSDEGTPQWTAVVSLHRRCSLISGTFTC